MFRNIEHTYRAVPTRMGKILLHQALPIIGIEQISPFILLHHFDFNIEPGDNSFYVPPHPHRGFCPITYMFDGSILHRDSKGNYREIHAYEVQWINAGRGIIHSESISPEFAAKGGRFQGIQLWINLPARRKMLPASYQPIGREDVVHWEETGTTMHLISGQLKNKLGPAESPEITAMVEMKPGAEFRFEFPPEHHSILYMVEGSITINQSTDIGRYEFAAFRKEEGEIHCKTETHVKLLVLSGKPIDEPMATHGPFVMNTETEILEAMRDFQSGRMGFLYE